MTFDAEQSTSPSGVISPQEEEQTSPKQVTKPAKRSRVSLACQRCKQRKQKCNGSQPSCARCTRLHLECHYVIPIFPKPGQAKIYIKALEDRVAELEMLLTKEGNKNVSYDHWADPLHELDSDEREDIQPLLNAVKDLSLDVGGSYVGASSTITLGRALESALAGKTHLIIPPTSSRRDQTARSEFLESEISSLSGITHFHLGQLEQDLADKMVNAYLGHLYTNFPILYSYDILDLHSRRHVLNDVYEESILHLIYGLGGHFLEKTSDAGMNYHPERHYEIAYDNREMILRFGDTRSLTYIMLLAQHCLRMPKDPGPWTFIGLAMRMCIELGLHRKQRSSKPSLKSELNKRLFWACYYWDREVSFALGRPPFICNHDIDVELPLDVDEAVQDLEVLQKASGQDRSRPAIPPTTMTCFIHLLRLKLIDSEVQHEIYRVDCPNSPQTTYEATDKFLEKYREWKDVIPPQAAQWDPTNRNGFRGDEYQSYDSYMASYQKSIRALLQPRLYEKSINDRYLKICTEACREVCETYRRLHNKIPLCFTSISLQTVFLAGLTLVYCMWLDASSSNSFKSVGPLSDCSIILYVITERWPAARKYRDLFESVKRSVLDAIAEGNHQPGIAVSSMKDHMPATIQDLQFNPVKDSSHDDLEQMINDMTGEALFSWEDVDMNEVIDPEIGSSVTTDFSSIFSPTSTMLQVSGAGHWYDAGFSTRDYGSGNML